MGKSNAIVFHTIIRFDDFIVRDHRVHDVRIMPGVTFLDIIYRGMDVAGFDVNNVYVKNIVFQEPIAVTEEYDKKIEVKIEKQDAIGIITVRSLKMKGDNIFSEEWDNNLSGELHFGNPMRGKTVDIQSLKANADNIMDMDEAYSFTRKGNIKHFDFMKVNGKIYEGEGYILSEHQLSNIALEHYKEFYLHPAHMDSSTIVPAILLFKDPMLKDANEHNMQPFIPIFMDSFYANGRITEMCYVLVQQEHVKVAGTKDIVYIDIEIYNEDGELLACIQRLANKRIRSQNLITKLEVVNKSDEMLEKTEKKQEVVPTKHQSLQTKEDVIQYLKTIVASEMNIDSTSIEEEVGFYDMGLESTNLLHVVKRIEESLQVQLYPTLLFEYSNIKELAGYLDEEYKDSVYGALMNQMPETTDVEEQAGVAELSETETPEPSVTESLSLLELVEKELICIIQNVVEDDTFEVSVEEGYYDQGLDSGNLMDIVKRIETTFQVQLYPTLLFEYNTVTALAEYLVEEFHEKVAEKYEKEKGKAQTKTQNDVKIETPIQSNDSIQVEHLTPQTEYSDDDIAVIGLCGKYPEADNIEEFWENLKAGKDCITEVPKDRWDHSQYYCEEKDILGKSYSKWGGFLRDVDKFDPLFFHIAPKEAEFIDPQERIFLENVYGTLEDAGYTKEKIGGRKVGVYVGVMWGQYQMLEGNIDGVAISPISFYASIANRISYYFNLKGPSIALDTMCSSSLTTIHLACESIRSGESEMALAGGVNVTVHPNKYIFLSQQHFASSEGKCRAFGEGGDGYVCGEGVGSVLLKSLKKAKADGDRIYGVIKASSINAGGRSSGFTVPNQAAQSDLIEETLQKGNIDPRTISYIEAHGTGTALGDPIEIAALHKVFKKYTADTGFCAVGSVKSNIGHLESAAGIASFTKAILQLYHKKLVPTLHASETNRKIDFDKTAFYVNQKLVDWNTEFDQPRRLAISSFGAGGANAHMILEEYQEPRSSVNRGRTNQKYPILVSARDKQRLQDLVAQLIEYVQKKKQEEEYSLENISYTLCIGREAMQERVAFLAGDIQELLDGLLNIQNEQYHKGNLVSGNIFENRSDRKQQVEAAIKQKDVATLIQLWAKGSNVHWNTIFQENTYRIVSLPTYPFARERYWVSNTHSNKKSYGDVPSLHPFIDLNASDFYAQKYKKTLYGNEPYLCDHVINGDKVLPAVVYLEMIRASVEQAMPANVVTSLEEVVLLQPIVVRNEAVEVCIKLVPEDGKVAFEICTDDGKCMHSTGKVVYRANEVVEAASEKLEKLEFVQAREQAEQVIPGKNIYTEFKDAGFQYGDSLRAVQNVFVSNGEVIAELEQNEAMKPYEALKIHPSIVDSSLQVVSVLSVLNNVQKDKVFLPYAFQEIQLRKVCTKKAYVWARKSSVMPKDSNTLHYDITIYDAEYEPAIVIRGFSLRSVKQENAKKNILLQPSWIEKPLEVTSVGKDKILLLFDDNRDLFRAIKEQGNYDKVIRIHCGMNFEQVEDGYAIQADNGEDFRKVLKDLQERNIKVEHILWNQNPFQQEQREEVSTNEWNQRFLSILDILQSLMRTKMAKGVSCIYLAHMQENMDAMKRAVAAICKTLQFENKNMDFRYVEIEDSIVEHVSQILNEYGQKEDIEIRYNNKKRYVRTLEELPVVEQEQEFKEIKEDGVYIITGGAGGLGKIFAEYLAHTSACNIILTGRSKENEKITSFLKNINATGKANVSYLPADVTDYESVCQLVQKSKEKFGRINGLIHSAGVLKDSMMIRKEPNDARAVLQPKICGSVYLDRATKDEPLDFFVLFSSNAAITGNMGQSDYAFGNAFMDEFVEWRKKQNRVGKSISINWPLWKDGGMHIDTKMVQEMEKATGVSPLEKEAGIDAFVTALQNGYSRMVVFYGDVNRIRTAIGLSSSGTKHVEVKQESVQSSASVEDRKILQIKTVKYLKEMLGKEIGLEASKIHELEPLEMYGIDSVRILSLTKSLERDFGELSKTLFFEYQTIKELSEYLLENHIEQLSKMFQLEPAQSTKSVPEETKQSNQVTEQKLRSILTRKGTQQEKKIANSNGDVAIIGLSGMYPEADNLEQFWMNLKNSVDCIVEIPEERWDHSKFYDPDKKKQGKTYAKWGGFLKDYKSFDPMFFHISPIEAEFTDPQERLFLQTAWSAVEDAAYTKKELSKYKVGVYVGVMSGQYQFYGVEESQNENGMALSSSYSSIANRVSYTLNLHGPSLAVDTMCSSSITAIKMALLSILGDECDMAIAGGVNLNLHPNKYIQLAQGKFASTDGRCRSFGEGGDGYVPGEGVGAVVLKRLDQAIEHGDHIYGVIKGCSINHGGKTNGYSVPNPNAQSDVIEEALEQAQIDARTVNYIEAHGTGTSLGDPIEITGLKKAFSKYTNDTQFCSIGSLKSNIGHLESAAGIASITKVLLQMKYGKLVPSLHSKISNPNIDFEHSPFYIQHDLEDWKPVILEEDGVEVVYPRRAGISCFGAGGSNGHIILEEYVQDAEIKKGTTTNDKQLFLLSARSQEALLQYAEKMVGFIKQVNWKEESFEQFLYTLQVGRESFEERLAIVSSSVDELLSVLEQFIKGNKEIEVLFTGNESTKQKYAFLIDEEYQDLIITKAMEEKNCEKLAKFWVNGMDFDWDKLYVGQKRNKMSLPTYPFAKEEYWVPLKKGEKKRSNTEKSVSVLHPMLDANQSTLYDVKFTKHLDYQQYYLNEHRVNGKKVLPAVAYLEMARAAGTIALEKPVTTVQGVRWIHAIEEEKVEDISINFEVNEDNIEFLVKADEGQEIVFAKGSVGTETPIQETISIKEKMAQCIYRESKETFYRRFGEGSIEYGRHFQCMDEVVYTEDWAVGKITIPKDILVQDAYVLHPCVLDVALQSIACLLGNEGGYVPAGVESVVLHKQDISEAMYLYTVKENILNTSQEVCFSCYIVSEDGAVLVSLQQVIMKKIANRVLQTKQDSLLASLLADVVSKKISVEETEKILGEFYE